MAPTRTPAQIEAGIRKVLGQYMTGRLTWGELMLLLQADAREGLAYADPDDRVVTVHDNGTRTTLSVKANR